MDQPCITIHVSEGSTAGQPQLVPRIFNCPQPREKTRPLELAADVLRRFNVNALTAASSRLWI